MNAPAPAALPAGLLLAYYGDDFTGSTDAMEAMASAGIPTVLFLEPPTPDLLQRFPGVRCVGLAGSSRGRDTAWMEAELPAAFASLARLGAPVLQYKICSTFDSSPTIGSIGKAIDLGTRALGGRWAPMVVGAPRLKRYQLFGNLFAAVDGEGYRLDRHPTMARHPVTPMAEADLRVHLRQQTARRIALVDMVQLQSGHGGERVAAIAGDDTPVVLIDVLDEATLLAAGQLIWEGRGDGVFTASSSGLQYALTAYWRKLGLIPPLPGLPAAQPAPVIAAVSGSCSPVTGAQIGWAARHGFATERLDVGRILRDETNEAEIERVVALACAAARGGTSVVVYSASGPEDPAVAGFETMARDAGLSRPVAARRVGAALAQVMRRMLDRTRLTRIVVAGGDSSGEVASALGISALSVIAGMAPGAPLCRVWSRFAQRDGLEIVLKGGQIGDESFFGSVLAGNGG
ncbi:four-carbon acid sugar kinase family protein [Cupriavidus basilensis]|uniref:Four-carbon acid sugar kinase family protein n=1 Tax=Cupriavidus basilensis TaxID=68895 RepID=A0ABT6AHX9_9BURK|nr:3-oxo-isoapionate kinase OiaK [Cupriavidus basilensis]MDF3831912.1 four-carbon acid sugar kinase family protein [Cupriavidus basilensis]